MPRSSIANFNFEMAFGPIPCNEANSLSVMDERSSRQWISAATSARSAGAASFGKAVFSDNRV